jgi:hypothetical protein
MVSNPIRQFGSNGLRLCTGISFLLNQDMSNGDQQFACNGDNRLLFADASCQALKLG